MRQDRHQRGGFASHSHAPPPRPATLPAAFEIQAPGVEAHLSVCDTLYFDVLRGQKCDRLGKSHADDIVASWSDGHQTKGIQWHIDDHKALFVFTPNITTKEHPIWFGSGARTTAPGVMTGTFSQPVPVSAGKTIPATGMAFALGMVTVGR